MSTNEVEQVDSKLQENYPPVPPNSPRFHLKNGKEFTVDFFVGDDDETLYDVKTLLADTRSGYICVRGDMIAHARCGWLDEANNPRNWLIAKLKAQENYNTWTKFATKKDG